MPSVDPLLDREHSDEYQCAHFVREAYSHLFRRELTPSFEGFLLPKQDRTTIKKVRHDFERVQAPEDRCIVVFRKLRGRPHVGLCYRGSILHLAKLGVQYLPIHVVALSFKSYQIYRPVRHG